MATSVAAAVAALTLALAGCVPNAPAAAPAPSPTATPIFASNEEALAAAEEAFRAYLAVYDEYAQDGWRDFAEVAPYLTGSAYEDEQATGMQFKAAGYRQIGNTTFDSTHIQSSAEAAGTATVVVYLCLDVSVGDVVDSSGASVVDPSRPGRLPLEVEFVGNASSLVIARSDPWSGNNFCT